MFQMMACGGKHYCKY